MPVWDAQFDDEIFGHDEAVVAKGRKLLEVLKSSNPYISERARAMMVQIISQTQSGELADFNDVVAHAKIAQGLPDYQNGIEVGRQAEIAAYGYLHDPSSMLRRLNELPPANNIDQAARLTNLATGEFMSERWHDAARDFGTIQTMADRLGPGVAMFEATAIWPYLAMADAALGARRHADALAVKMPLDCMWCTIARGRVDELEGKSDSAARWFANAQKQAPSIPFPDLYWGHVLLHRRDLDGAIAKFDSAHKKGPHFADPLEMWGEALIAKNRSDLALAKFEEAAKYAPNWGRLHLKWGEALWWSGHKDEAAKQFALARTLDLTGAERAELSRMSS
jgi:tetratricopeptide (TPR) repeat protein